LKIPLIDLKAQYTGIKDEIQEAMAGVLDSTQFIGGEAVNEFEQAFCQATGQAHCVGVGNGTDALYLALRALGVGSGHEVLVPVNTFIATAEAVTLTGAKPVFVDVDESTGNISPTSCAERITKASKAIIPVHLYGRPADLDPLLKLAKAHDLLVVEDAAQAHLAMYKNRPIGSDSHATCYSFYPGKNLGAYGDGGAVVTNDKELADKVRRLSNQGRLKKFDHEWEGVNSRLDALQAAILRVKLRHLRAWTDSRRSVASQYGSLLDGDLMKLPSAPIDGNHVYHLYVIRTPFRDQVRQILADKGIGCGIHYPIPLHLLTAYRHLNHAPGDFPNAEKLAGEILSLPMYAELTSEQVAFIASSLNDTLRSLLK